ncbi:hypothetical protein FJZ36_07195 [Candidatus Poribacteria bacterium]|nr:hypothetical protein [Candidatus Poribacteria bacterium]
MRAKGPGYDLLTFSIADPTWKMRLRKQFGKDLRLWGAVDKREIAKGPAAIDAVMRELAPMIEDGGFIPTLDHTFPPDISWDNFAYYMEQKERLLTGAWGT